MATPARIIMLCLIQCGETAWESDDRIHGSTDLPLSDAGRAATSAEAQRIMTGRVAVVNHPPDEAASDTAHLFARKFGARTKAVKELADPNLGLLEGLRRGEFAERFPSRHRQWEDEPMLLQPPEGEPLTDAAARIYTGIARLLRRSRSEEVAVVLHPIALGMLRCWLGDRRANDLWLMLVNRPRVERYAMTIDMLDELESAAASVTMTTA